MTSHALTDAQEEAIHHACLDLMDLPHYSDSRHEDSLRILRDLARTLLEPVEKERDEAKRYSREYIDMTDPLISCGVHDLADAGKGDPGIPCGDCRRCFWERLQTAERYVARMAAEAKK